MTVAAENVPVLALPDHPRDWNEDVVQVQSSSPDESSSSCPIVAEDGVGCSAPQP
eukprot:CAMPEP_0184324048 /NCGR_PEP_ID=MMETSP1049-20130417/133378_1 /TAXON_ID=77928 /ORGANISM="Proteomonas sulcata, Strain CCMP704" /LENGTH=54 /DNA_ID=CAMNT_0026645717 /DNA_START=37 /DNA_END=198 /DNA_ORIENTATION=+